MVSLLALAAAAFLLVDAINEPSRRPAGLLFVFLCLVFAWRARYARSSTYLHYARRPGSAGSR